MLRCYCNNHSRSVKSILSLKNLDINNFPSNYTITLRPVCFYNNTIITNLSFFAAAASSQRGCRAYEQPARDATDAAADLRVSLPMWIDENSISLRLQSLLLVPAANDVKRKSESGLDCESHARESSWN